MPRDKSSLNRTFHGEQLVFRRAIDEINAWTFEWDMIFSRALPSKYQFSEKNYRKINHIEQIYVLEKYNESSTFV